ncbi:hypothetical protein BT63DRAFT_442100 [Microthyrium microscopicum]|uniref:EF-hand n=1 Tax=Microthyrium microscopicum TaxID=703497 RepID=A0A6A6U7M8_9PEZI|nr:hypothetical protein BT63DRAFT_442100 [Microthyrium microscopicum]
MADPLSKSGSLPNSKQNYTPDERQLFGRLFRECDTEGSGIVTGEAAVRMFQRSRLNEQVLSEIWAMADTENRGFLVQEDFAKAMRLVGQYQASPGITLRPEIALSPGPLPKFDGINMQPTGGASFPPPAAITSQHSGPIRVPPLTPDRIQEYMRLFDRAGAQNGLLPGDIARTSFELSGLPGEILAQIWNLVDTEQRGSLNLTEFIIAMHLLASYKAKTLTQLPPTIPPGLYEAASRRPGNAPVRSPLARPGEFQQIPRQASGSNSMRSGQQPRPFASQPPPAAEWAIGPREKTSYDELFDKVDTLRQNHISGEQAVQFFSDSGLPSEVLAAIWDLANIRRLDQLNRDEFAVAMYLIRNQRGKQQSDLPTELPPNLIPPSMRQVVPQSTGLPYPAAPQQAPIPAPAPPKSHAEDLFGLDALTSSPGAPVKEQNTGESAPLNRPVESDPFGPAASSPGSSQNFNPRGNQNTAGANTFFKSFAPSSSFGQTLATQNTGASTGSSPSVSQKQANPMSDLLSDHDPTASKKLTQETGDLADMSNQMSMLRTQMQAVHTKKQSAESELASSSTQKRDMELRLQQFRSQYEQEVKALKTLEDQLTAERTEASKIGQQISMVQSSFQDVQTRHHQVSTTLESTKAENASLKDRLRQMNEYINQAQPEIEKMQSELRHQKGMVAIQKKQAEKLDEEKAQLEKMKSEMNEIQQQAASRPPASREVTSGSSSSTNPFMRRSPQTSVDNTMTPSGFSRTMSNESNKYENIFNTTTFSSPSTATAPSTSFRDAFNHPPGSSVRSSEPDMPTPSTSPPLSASAYQESPQVPMAPISRQMTSKDLPLEKPSESDSLATSVRVETPSSRYDFSTPTNVGSSPQTSSVQAARGPTSTGASMFDKTSSPVASLRSEASKPANKDHSDLFQSMSSTKDASPFGAPPAVERNYTGTSAFTDQSRDSAKPEAPEPPRGGPFSFPSGQGQAGGKSEFDDAFASLGKEGKRPTDAPINGGNDPLDKFNSEFPPLKDEFPAPSSKPKSKDEFPPIKETDVGEDSESDVGGFDDDFTKASPPSKKPNNDTERGFGSSSQDFNSMFQGFPAPDPPSSSGGPDFGAPLPKQLSGDRAFGAPSSGSRGEDLFGPPSGPKVAGGPSASMYSTSTSPPETNRTSNRSDTYQSAVSHQSTDQDFPLTDATSSTAQAPSKLPMAPSAFDDFDSGFDNLTDAKEADEQDNDDLLFDSSHGDDHEFIPSFDSPTASMSKSKPLSDRTATGSGAPKSAFSNDNAFDDFESNFGAKPSSSSGPSSKLATAGSPHDWDAMFKGIDEDHSGTPPSAPMPPMAPMPPTSSSGAPLTAPSPPNAGQSLNVHFGGKDFDDHGPAFPEAPQPPSSRPKLSSAISTGTEHDDPILKRLTSMGHPRPLALNALEKFDYDLNKAADYLASPK